jgi:SAM-dependent methyltransferase
MSLKAEMNLTTRAPDVVWTHRSLPLILDAIPVNCKSLLDVGCGRGIIGALCRIYRGLDRLVGVDGFEPYLEFNQKAGFYDHTILRDLNDTPLPFDTQEFEAVTCIEVIEHLERSAGQKLLDELERIGSRVIVTTPNIRFQQREYDGNIFQKHLSGWNPSDFRARGYSVYGAGSLNVGYALKNVTERVVGPAAGGDVLSGIKRSARYISQAFGPLTHDIPRLSTNLLCVLSQRRQNGDRQT